MDGSVGRIGRCALAVLMFGALAARAAGPRIEHTPVTVIVRGQPLVVRARVTDPSRPVRSVTLYYSTARDAAPFEVSMNPTAPGSYIGTVPENVLSGLTQIAYYLAAENNIGAMSETPWHTVAIRTPQPGEAPPPGTGEGAVGQERPKWVVPALIAGGVALAAGGALIAANSSSSGGGGGGGLDLQKAAGTYAGEVSLREQPPGDLPEQLTTRACRITLAPDGGLTTSDLHQGKTLNGRLSGNSFVLSTTVERGGSSGEIRYLGTVVDNRIVGTIQGSVVAAEGTYVFSGIFSAVKP